MFSIAATSSGVHLSKAHDLHFEMCTPRPRWIPCAWIRVHELCRGKHEGWPKCADERSKIRVRRRANYILTEQLVQMKTPRFVEAQRGTANV